LKSPDDRRQKRRRRDRMRQAIRSALAGVALALMTIVPAFADTAQYTVQPGDSLNAVADRLGVRSTDLAALNDLGNADDLQVGQVLRLPSGAEIRVAPVSRGGQPSFMWPVRGPITTGYR